MEMTKTTTAGHVATWRDFVAELQERILPLYKRHEATFDPFGVHGRVHICRSVMFAEWMARFRRASLSEPFDFHAARVAVALHDSGRRANGPDLWEADSAENCRRYVAAHPPPGRGAEYADYVAGLIGKSPAAADACQFVVHDADVLEIMRPCCGRGGLAGFRREFLHFAGPHDPALAALPDAARVREELIQEAWRWIQETERIKLRFYNSATFLEDLLDWLARERASYPMLSSLLP